LRTSIRIHTREHPRDRATNPKAIRMPGSAAAQREDFRVCVKVYHIPLRPNEPWILLWSNSSSEAITGAAFNGDSNSYGFFHGPDRSGFDSRRLLSYARDKRTLGQDSKTSQVLELLQLPCVRTEHSLPAQESATGVPYFAGTVTAWLVIETCTMYERPAAFTGAG